MTGKANPPSLLRGRRNHQLADGIEYDFELRVAFLFEFFQFASKFLMGSQHFAQADEMRMISMLTKYGLLASQDARQHRDTFLRERVGERATQTAFGRYHIL